MNKQELIDRIKGFKKIFGNKIEYIELDMAIELVSRLDEPQKPVVPEIVNAYIQDARECDWDIEDLFNSMKDEENKELLKWFYHECNQETLALAWINGYTVVKEKRYEVILCNGQSLKTVYRQGGDRLDFEKVYGDLEIFTRKQLEDAGFGWVFNCEGIVVREAE